MEQLTINQKKILKSLDTLPPTDIIYNYTPEQKNYLQELKKQFELIQTFFKAFFLGEPIPAKTLQGESKEFYLAKFYYFLSFYILLQCGWEYLSKTSEFHFENPSECFIEVLKNHSKAQVHICQLGRFDIRPRHKNEMRRLANKIKKGEASDIQTSSYNKYINALVNLGFSKFASLEIFCVKTCAKNAGKDHWLEAKLEDYYENFKKVQEINQRTDRNRKGYAWENGRIRNSRKNGGTYS